MSTNQETTRTSYDAMGRLSKLTIAPPGGGNGAGYVQRPSCATRPAEMTGHGRAGSDPSNARPNFNGQAGFSPKTRMAPDPKGPKPKMRSAD